jgi:hypothetical protein
MSSVTRQPMHSACLVGETCGIHMASEYYNVDPGLSISYFVISIIEQVQWCKENFPEPTLALDPPRCCQLLY